MCSLHRLHDHRVPVTMRRLQIVQSERAADMPLLQLPVHCRKPMQIGRSCIAKLKGRRKIQDIARTHRCQPGAFQLLCDQKFRTLLRARLRSRGIDMVMHVNAHRAGHDLRHTWINHIVQFIPVGLPQ